MKKFWFYVLVILSAEALTAGIVLLGFNIDGYSETISDLYPLFHLAIVCYIMWYLIISTECKKLKRVWQILIPLLPAAAVHFILIQIAFAYSSDFLSFFGIGISSIILFFILFMDKVVKYKS